METKVELKSIPTARSCHRCHQQRNNSHSLNVRIELGSPSVRPLETNQKFSSTAANSSSKCLHTAKCWPAVRTNEPYPKQSHPNNRSHRASKNPGRKHAGIYLRNCPPVPHSLSVQFSSPDSMTCSCRWRRSGGEVRETLHWPKKELSRKSVLNVEKVCSPEIIRNPQGQSMTVLRDTFTTGTSSYNVLLQSKEEKKQPSQKEPFVAQNKKRRKGGKLSSTLRSKEHHKTRTSSQNNSWMYARRNMSALSSRSRATSAKSQQGISVAGNGIGFSLRPKVRSRRKHYFSSFTSGKESNVSKTREDVPGKKCCILNAIKPLNIEKERLKFFKSAFIYDPQFEYANPALPNVLARHSHASDRFLKQAVNIMLKALEKYGNYEKFEQATGGCLLPKSRIWHQVRKYMEKEGCLGEIVVHLTDDLLSRASMTVVNGRPTLTINISTAREQWLEGMLRHEIGTHYFRGMNNNQQLWNNGAGRKKYGLKPINPTEEGLASIHSVLFRKDPFLWRAALLYYTVYQASHMSFSQLFQDVGRFVKDPNTRWDYCVRAKRGCTDTSQPGCFNKDQVYLDGILRILRHRETIDFRLLTAMGKVSYEDIERLKDLAVLHNARVPQFLQDSGRYMEYLEKIMQVNDLTDEDLRTLIG